MKKVFCDFCGEEFAYDDALVRAANHTPTEARRKLHVTNIFTELEVVVSVRASTGIVHKDICGTCRWDVIDSVDPRQHFKFKEKS